VSGKRNGRRCIIAVLVLAAMALAAPATASAAPDNLGTDFWVGYMTNFQGGAAKTMFITGPTATSGNVSVPGLAFSQDFTVTPGQVTSVDLPAGAEMPSGEGTADVAVHITANDEVTVYGLSRIQFTTDAYLGLPSDVVTNNYTAMGWGTGLGGVSELGIVATHDATTVTITPTVDTAGGHVAGTPYDVSLNAGQMYQIQSTSNTSDLTGTRISATDRVSVFGGHQCANIPNNQFFACDHVTEQLFPNDTWGRSFLTVPLKTRVNGDTFKFLAQEDGTEVRVNGTPVATLNAGEQFQQIIDGVSQITANHPILVSQFSNSSSFDGVTSDPFMMLIPPFEQFQTGYTITTPGSGFDTNFVNIVAPDAAVGQIAVDGNPIPASDFTPIGSTGFQGAQVDLTVGSHNITGPGQPFGAFVYGFASFDSYGYPGGAAFAPVARVTGLSLSPGSETVLVNTQHCVTASVTDSNGQPVGGVRVDFTVSGANTASGSVTAGDNGQAEFCYTGTNTGNDTITARVGELTASATKNWVTSLPSTTTTTPATTTTPPATTPATPVTRARLRASARGVPTRGCTSSAFVVRVSVAGPTAGLRVRVRLDGRTIATSRRARFTVRVNGKRLSSGRHRITVVATANGATRATRTVAFRRCARVRPTLTG
jgi:hypothetical protein